MARLLLFSADADAVLPSLELLPHQVRRHPASPAHVASAPEADVLLVDGRTDLVGAKTLCRLLTGTVGASSPVLLIVTEGGLSAVSADWGFDDVLLAAAGPAEADARIRLAISRAAASEPDRVQASGVTIDEQSYSAKLHGKPLDLTYKEFQLLHFLATHPDRVFTREQLLSEVWGYDYFGGTRTVDVHVRRLRAKLGDADQIIGTVRNVGYRFNIYDDHPTEAS
ncbi:response regulator transcription factor [Microbacterium sp.]|uniref:response regulator transcription factor n=1 Tax=Microbacterium sp. TaxID=51671 RepID=UPI00333ED2B6